MQTLGVLRIPLDSLTAWFSDHGNHQEGQSREDGLGGKRWGTSAKKALTHSTMGAGSENLLDEQGGQCGLEESFCLLHASSSEVDRLQRQSWEMSGSCQEFFLIHFSRRPELALDPLPQGMFSFLDFLRLSPFGL